MHSLTTSSITSRFLVAMLDGANATVDEVLQSAGVSRDQLSSPDCRMPLDAFRELWERAALLQPDIGLRLVERFPEGQMHVLAHLAMRSATIEEAMDALCRYAPVTSPADFMKTEKSGNGVRFIYEQRMGGQTNPWLVEHYFSMIVLFLTRAIGRALPILKIEFVSAAQAPIPAYVDRFGKMPVFNAASNNIEFDAEILHWPLLTHDAYMHGILDKVVKAEFPKGTINNRATDSWLENARREIAKGFLKGLAPGIDEVAIACHSSVRAFRDRLATENTTFRELLDEVRRSLACEHLSRGLSVSEAAYLLGFSEPSAFQHACKRWFDKSAGEIRRQLLDATSMRK